MVKVGRGVKIGVVIAVLVALGLAVNALTSPAGVGLQFTPAEKSPPPGPPRPGEVETVVTRTTTATQTVAGGTSYLETSLPAQRMEIFSARISLEVKNVRATMDEIAGIARQLDGYVAGSSASVLDGREAGTISIRVPRERFYQAVAAVEALGELKDKATQSDDVTQEYIDLTARRDNLQRQEERLQEILALGDTVDDVLKVESELWRVRGEIERLTGRINYLERNVAMSTIMVSLTEPPEAPLPELDWGEPFRTGLAFLHSAVRGLVIFLFTVIPFAVIGVPAYLVYRHRRNKRRAG